MIKLLLLFVVAIQANYTVHLIACHNTDCQMDKPRMGHVEMGSTACNITATHTEYCGETKRGNNTFTMSRVCVASLDDLWFNHVRASTYNETCDSDIQTIRIIATDLCEGNTTFIVNTTDVSMNIYNNNQCTGTPVTTYAYALNTCIIPSASHYTVPVIFHYTEASARKRGPRIINKR